MEGNSRFPLCGSLRQSYGRTSLTPFTFPIGSVLPRPLGSRGALAGVRCQSPHEVAVGSRLLGPLLAAVRADRPRAGCPAPARLIPTPKGSDVLYSPKEVIEAGRPEAFAKLVREALIRPQAPARESRKVRGESCLNRQQR
jgi:hypothetical protein